MNYDDLNWQRSSFTDGVQCVQVARHGDKVFLRDDKIPDQVVAMTPGDFAAFAQGVKAGEFDEYC